MALSRTLTLTLTLTATLIPNPNSNPNPYHNSNPNPNPNSYPNPNPEAIQHICEKWEIDMNTDLPCFDSKMRVNSMATIPLPNILGTKLDQISSYHNISYDLMIISHHNYIIP